MMARPTGREQTLHATRRAPAHTHNLIRYTTTGDTINLILPGQKASRITGVPFMD
jgi:hypothetical protein